jgi:release factor glutamine methyltransferase
MSRQRILTYCWIPSLLEAKRLFLQERFNAHPSTDIWSPSPLVLEIGTGSGVVVSFIGVYAEMIFGRSDICTAGVDVNRYACQATEETVRVAEQDQRSEKKFHGCYLGNIVGDLARCLRPGVVDVLIFNPPYVPTPDLPELPSSASASQMATGPSFEDDSHLLSLSYAGGEDGMETTYRLLNSLPEILSKDRGCAYILLCAQNKPEQVTQRIRRLGSEWLVETVGRSGKKAGWEKLQIIRIWRTQLASVANGEGPI